MRNCLFQDGFLPEKRLKCVGYWQKVSPKTKSANAPARRALISEHPEEVPATRSMNNGVATSPDENSATSWMVTLAVSKEEPVEVLWCLDPRIRGRLRTRSRCSRGISYCELVAQPSCHDCNHRRGTEYLNDETHYPTKLKVLHKKTEMRIK